MLRWTTTSQRIALRTLARLQTMWETTLAMLPEWGQIFLAPLRRPPVLLSSSPHRRHNLVRMVFKFKCVTLFRRISVPAAHHSGASWAYLMYPVILTAGGLLGCLLVSILAPRMLTISQASHVERALRWLLLVSCIRNRLLWHVLCDLSFTLPQLSTAAVAIVDYVFSLIFLPDKFSLAPATDVEEGDVFSTRTNAFVCVLVGSIGGLAIGLVTELYTSKSYKPVKRVRMLCLPCLSCRCH